MDEAVTTIIQSGLSGALLVILGIAYWRKEQDLKASQEARVADAQKVAKDSLEREDKWQDLISELTRAVERLTDNAGRPR